MFVSPFIEYFAEEGNMSKCNKSVNSSSSGLDWEIGDDGN